MGPPLCHSNRYYEWLRDCVAHCITDCPFMYPFVPKEASLKHLSLYYRYVNVCIRKHNLMRVHLIVFLFLYLYVCDATMRINRLIIRHLQWHNAKYLRSFVRYDSPFSIWIISWTLGFLIRFNVESAIDTLRRFCSTDSLSKQTLIGIDAHTFYYQLATGDRCRSRWF